MKRTFQEESSNTASASTGRDVANKDAAAKDHNSTRSESEKELVRTPFKKQCPFCGKQFAYLGTYGRHLDSRKGDELHPTEKVAEIRLNVVRRGGENTEGDVPVTLESVEAMVEKALKYKEKRKVSSKAYNEKAPVRERNKLRRKQRDEHIKAKMETLDWVLGHFSAVTTPQTFAGMVCLLLPPAKWPLGTPDEETFDLLLDTLSNNPDNETLGRLHSTFNVWERQSAAEQRQAWGHELRKCLGEIIGNRTLYEILCIPMTAEVMVRRPENDEKGVPEIGEKGSAERAEKGV